METNKFLKSILDAMSEIFFLAYLKQKNIFARGKAILKHTKICLKFEFLDLECDLLLLIFNYALNSLPIYRLTVHQPLKQARQLLVVILYVNYEI